MKKKLVIHLYTAAIIASLIGAGVVVHATVMNTFRGKTAGAAVVLESESLSEAGRAKGVGTQTASASANALTDTAVSDNTVSDNAVAVTETRTVETPTEEVQEETWGYTNLGVANVDNHLNVRETPEEGGKLVGKMTKNAACEILSVENNWAHIKSGKVEGYASLDYLFTGEQAKAKAREVATAIATVNTQTLKVREEPSTESTVLTLVPIEEKLEVDAVEGDWVKIFLDDETAYVSAEYVDISEQLDTAVTMTELMYGKGVTDVKIDLCQYAKQFIGNPYVWGGVSLTKGADCSGFVLSVYKKYGISLPHHSGSQAQYGTKVSASEVEPGDLVFYAKNGKINHVAIYIGNGQVVHASSPRTGIRISNMYYRTPYTIRRLIP